MVYEDKLRLEEAREHYKDEKYSEALIIFMDLMLASPTNGLLFFDIAKTYLKMGQPTVAMANFEKSLKFLDKVHHYDLQKEFAAMLHGMNRHQEAVNVYQPVTANAVNEEDFITGVKYLMHTEEIDQAELLLMKNIVRFPNSFDTVCETAEVEPYIIERLRNRKRSIIQALKDNFQPTIDDTSEHLDYIIAESEENTYQHLLTDWDSGLDDFDDAKTIDKVIAAKERLNAVRTVISSESKKIKELKATTAISELRQDNRDKIRELNDLETDLLALLPQLPATSLKAEIPSYLNVVKNFKKQIRKDNYLEVSRAFKNLDNLLSEGKGYQQDGKAAIEKIAAMQAPTEKGLAKRNVSVSKKAKNRRKKEDDTVIVLDSQLNKRKKGNRKVLLFFLFAIIVGGGGYYVYNFIDLDKNKLVLLTGVKMRSKPSKEAEQVKDLATGIPVSYPKGEKLTVLNDYGDWVNVRSDEGFEGYMRREYFVTPSEFKFIKGMFPNEESEVFFESARHRTALLDFYKENEWTSKVSSRIERKVHGHTKIERDVHQIYAKEFKGGIIDKLTYNGSEKPYKDMACIIRGEENENIVFFTFNENREYKTIGHEILEGLEHQMEFIETSDTRRWYLGQVNTGGSRALERLRYNSVLVKLEKNNDCILYHYDNELEKIVGDKQDFCN